MSKLNFITVLTGLFMVSCGPQRQDLEPSNYNTMATNDSNGLPNYLLTENDLRDINMVMPFINRQDLSAMKMALSYRSGPIQKLMLSLGQSLNTAASIDALAPGRQFKLLISDSRLPNAFASGAAEIGFLPIIFELQGKEILPALCHEMSHSFQNHSDKFDRFIKENAAADQKDINAIKLEYLTSTYDQKTMVYTHNSELYKKFKSIIEIKGSKIGEFSKRQESFADVIGAMVCAELGMDPNEYIYNLKSTLKTLTGLVSKGLGLPPLATSKSKLEIDEIIADGETLRLPVDDAVSLLGIDDHPTNEERDKQLQRLLPVIQTHYRPNVTNAQEFIATYDQFVSPAKEDLQSILNRWTATINSSGSSSPNVKGESDDSSAQPQG